MRYLKYLFLLVGLGLLVFVVSEIEVAQVVERVGLVGWGITVILGLYLVAFVIDSFTWHMALTLIPLNLTWLYRVWKVRMVGEVFNSILPMASMGGEPVKAVLLKKYYDIGYREGTASLLIGRTINMLALVIFLAMGFALMWASPVLPTSYKVFAGMGLFALGLGTALFFFIQRLKVSTITGTWISRWRFTLGVEKVMHLVRDVDERLVRFYTRHLRRFSWAILLAFVNWLIGVLEIYYSMAFLGHPVSLTDAWIIEAAAQLVRTSTFFIPSSIGAQEGTFLLICSAMTGSPVAGIAVALIRRFREIFWILWGLLLGAMFPLKKPSAVR